MLFPELPYAVHEGIKVLESEGLERGIREGGSERSHGIAADKGLHVPGTLDGMNGVAAGRPLRAALGERAASESEGGERERERRLGNHRCTPPACGSLRGPADPLDGPPLPLAMPFPSAGARTPSGAASGTSSASSSPRRVSMAAPVCSIRVG